MTPWEIYKKKRGLGEPADEGAEESTSNNGLSFGNQSQTPSATLQLPQSQTQPKQTQLSIPTQPTAWQIYLSKRVQGWTEEYETAAARALTTENAARTENDLKNRYVISGGHGMPTMGMAMQQSKQPMQGGAYAALDPSKTQARTQNLYTDIQSFTKGDGMSAEDIENYGDIADELKRDAIYSVAWLTNNKSRISEEEYRTLSDYYKWQKDAADYAQGIVDYYKGGGNAQVYANYGNMVQEFKDGTVDFERLAGNIVTLTQQDEELATKERYLQEDIFKLQNTEMLDEAGQAEKDRRLADWNTQLETVQAEREAIKNDLDYLTQTYWSYLSIVDTYADNDPRYLATTAEGKIRYEGIMKAFEEEKQANIDAEGWNTRGIDFTPNEPIVAAREKYPLAVDIDHMTEDELNRFYYLVGAGYDWQALSYANQTVIARREEKNQKWASSVDSWQDIIPATVAYSLMFPAAGYDYFANQFAYANTGLEAHTSLGPAGVRDAIVGGAVRYLNDKAGAIDEDASFLAGKGWGDAYQTLVSTGESYG